MIAAEAVLARLAGASRAEVAVTSAGVSGTGAGIVKASREGDTVVLAETGEWAPAGGRPMRWRASSRWRVEGAALAVEHVRQGPPAAAVLERQPNGSWVGREPYVCGHDRYACTVCPEGEALTVAWTITGPRKAARVVTRYVG